MDKAGEWLVLMAYVAIIFVLVRPKSQGPKLVTAIGNSVSSITKAATGGGSW
jgi:hypothetical protein